MEALSMSQEYSKKPLAIALGAAFVTSLATTPAANATANPFAMSELPGGYMVAEKAEGKCGEGKCGASKKTMEEGKCGSDKAGKEGNCGANKKMTEEGKCGGNKQMTDEDAAGKEGD
jgi:uncharacterized low-complexity protein